MAKKKKLQVGGFLTQKQKNQAINEFIYGKGFNPLDPTQQVFQMSGKSLVPKTYVKSKHQIPHEDFGKLYPVEMFGMKKKKKKLQMGAELLASSKVLPEITDNIEKEPKFATKKDFDAYHLEQAIGRLSPEDRQWYEDAKLGKIKNVTPQDIIALRSPTPEYPSYLKKKAPIEPMGNVLGRAYGLKNGGKVSKTGYKKNSKDKNNDFNIIPSNRITMKDVEFPVLGVSNLGDTQLMQPEGEYNYNGDFVTEFPMAKSGIHIKPENKGKFTKKAKAKGKGVQEFASQVLANKENYSPSTVKQANFARNAKKFKHGQFGLEQELPTNPYGVQPIQTNWGSENLYTPNQFTTLGQLQQFNNTLPQQGQGGGFMGMSGGLFGGGQGKGGGLMGAGNTLNKIIGGVKMIKAEKERKEEMRKAYKISKLVKKASALEPDQPERKYHRPEDQILDPNTVAPSYGVGTNYLEYGGELPKAQWGKIANQAGASDQIGNTAGMIGSFIGGGGGQQSGASVTGGTVGGAIGSIWGPVGEMIGTGVGSLIGGVAGGKTQKYTRRYERRALNNLQTVAFNQGAKGLRNQYTGFMEMGGELEMLQNGSAETMSYNPYLPDNGETVIFRGASHENGGIPVNFGNNVVEVEGGEPAVKLQNGGQDNLTVFGNMKIPPFGVLELNDPKAKGKKFKNYIKDLSESEAKNNKIVDNSIKGINSNPVGTPFDKLKFGSDKAMLEGANMNLKNIANKKQTAAMVQNAILETANEFNLKPDELAKGKIKKAPKGSNKAQDGKRIPRSEVQSYLDQGWLENPENPNQLMMISSEPGRSETINIGDYRAGSKEFQDAFAKARKQKLGEFDFKGKKYTTDLWKGRTETISYPGVEKRDYLDIYDPSEGGVYPEPIIEDIATDNVKTAKETSGDKLGLLDIVNAALPWLRHTNQLPLDPNQLSGEMLALASNQLEPVQAQLYHPLLEQATDISYQDQLNENQATFNQVQRLTGYSPESQAALAGQKYQANQAVLAEQFRQNQMNKQAVYNRNRQTLNDAQLRNLGILDQQYVRQAQAKSNTKATAIAALSSISDKIAKNKLENRTLGVYENLYNYRFLPQGQAFNLNPLAQFNIPQVGENLPLYNDSVEVTDETTVNRDRAGIPQSSRTKHKEKSKKSNGGLVKYSKGY